MRLFSRYGYDATSVNQIIADAGISKGAFYHHFESKESLVEALAALYAEEAAAAARPILEDASLDSYSRLASFLASMRQQKLDSAEQIRTTFEPLFRPENVQLYHRTQRAVTSVMRPILAGIIAQGVEENCFDTSDAEEAAETILYLFGSSRDDVGAIFQSRDELERRRLVERFSKRMRYLSTVVDRILGVPEGSIEIIDREAIDIMLASWARADDAA
jgi:AcrR family transcriptional regulator